MYWDIGGAIARPRFYRNGLGWPTKGIVGKEFEHGAVAFFDVADADGHVWKAAWNPQVVVSE